MIKYVFQKFRNNGYAKPIKGKVYVKQEKKDEIKNEAVNTSKRESNANIHLLLEKKIDCLLKEKNTLLLELTSIKTKHQHTYYDLQKKDQAIKSINNQKEQLEKKVHLLQLSNQKLVKELNLKTAQAEVLEKTNEENVSKLKKELQAVQTKLLEQEKTLKKERSKRDEAKIAISKLSHNNRLLSSQLSIGQNHNHEEKNDNIYEVEQLIGHKLKNKTWYFHVHWKGYNSSYDTWEPKRNLNCPKILNKYISEHNILL